MPPELEKAEPTPPTSYVCVIQELVDDQGRRVMQRKLVHGTAPPEFNEFIGLSALQVTFQGQPQIQNYRFDIVGAKTIEEAFTRFDNDANVYGRILMERIQRGLSEKMAPKVAAARPEEVRRLLKLPGE